MTYLLLKIYRGIAVCRMLPSQYWKVRLHSVIEFRYHNVNSDLLLLLNLIK